MYRYVGTFLFMWLITAVVRGQQPHSEGALYTEERQLLFTMDTEYPYYLVRVNEQRTKLSVANSVRGGKKAMVWWGTESTVLDCPGVLRLTISPDGQRVAYIGMDTKMRQHVIVDGKTVGKYGFVFFDTVVFSPDGQRYAFAVSESGKRGKKDCRVISDGKKGRKYHSIIGLPPEFSPDSKHLVYFAREDEDWYGIIDEERGPAFRQTGYGPQFSPDGSQWAYVGMQRDEQFLVVNGKLLGPYEEVVDVTYSPTTNDLAYILKYKDSSRVYLNHRPYGPGYRVARSPTFSPDGSRFGFWVMDGSRDQFVVVDSVKRRVFPGMSVSTPWFSDDSRHFIYDVATDESLTERQLVVDDSIIGHMNGMFDVLETRFSPDGSRFGFGWDVDDTEMRGVVDGAEFVCRPYCGPIVFSPDSKNYSVVALMGSEEASMMIVNGKEFTRYTIYYSGQQFTPDSRNLGFVAKFQGKQFVVIGEQELTKYDGVYPKEIEFNEDGSLAYFGFDGMDVYRVLVKPSE